MKISCDVKEFSKALTAVRRIAVKNSTVPSLSCVRFSLTNECFLRLACYDTQTYVIQDVPTDMFSSFVPVLIVAQDLHDFVKTFKSGVLEFEMKEGSNSLIASVGSASVTLDVFRENEYSWPQPTDRLPEVGHVEWRDFTLHLSQVAFAASSDDSKSETLKSTYFLSDPDGLEVVCTDGDVMAISTGYYCGMGDFTALVSQTASDALEKFFSPKDNVIIGQADGMIEFVSGMAMFQTKLVRGHFPDYQKAIPSTYSGGLRAPTKALIEKLTFLKPCGTICLATDMNTLTASGTSEDKVFSSSLEVEKAKGGDLSAILPSKPLLAILSKIKDEKVVFKWSADRNIVRIYPSGRDNHQTYLIKYGEPNV